MSGEEKISINIGQDKKIELEVEVDNTDKNLFVKLTPEIVKTIVEAGINSENFIVQVREALTILKAQASKRKYGYKENAIFSYQNESESPLDDKRSFEFLAQLFEKNVHYYINDAGRFLNEIEGKYKEEEFLPALAEWQLSSVRDEHKGKGFQEFLKTEYKSDQKTVLDEATRTKIEEAVNRELLRTIANKDKYKEPKFLAALAEWQLRSGQEFQEFLETKDELDKETVLKKTEQEEIKEKVKEVASKVRETWQKIDDASKILEAEQSSEIQKLNVRVELFELISQIKQEDDEAPENIIIKEKLLKLGITKETQLTHILKEEKQKLLWETINREDEEVEGDKIIATKLLIKLYQNKGYLKDNQITKKDLEKIDIGNLAVLYRASIGLGSEDKEGLSLKEINDKTFGKVIELLEKLGLEDKGDKIEIKMQDKDLEALRAYIKKEAEDYKYMHLLNTFNPSKRNTIETLAKLCKENEELYNTLMRGIELENKTKLENFERAIEATAEKLKTEEKKATEEKAKGVDVYGHQKPIDSDELEKELNKKFVDTCEGEDVKEKRQGIIARIIAFLLGIRDDSERNRLATYIQNFKDFDQLKDFDKSLNGIVTQTRKRLDSIFLKSYNHRRDRLEHYTNILEVEKACIALSKKIDDTQDKKVKKTLKGNLEEALEYYRDISGKHRYSLLITKHQLKKIESNIEKTKEHMEKHKKALEVLKDTTGEVTTEVAGRRAQNNQLLRKVGLIR